MQYEIYLDPCLRTHLGYFLDQSSDKLFKLSVLIEDAEVETVKQDHGVLLNIIRVVNDGVYDFCIEPFLFGRMLLAQSERPFEPVC